MHCTENNKDGTFAEVTKEAGLQGLERERSEAVCKGDYNNDGYTDLYVVSLGGGSQNTLYKNNRDGTFSDVTEQTGTRDVGDGRTCRWLDYDGDGFLDLITTNHASKTRLFKNLGSGKFEDVAEENRYQVGYRHLQRPQSLIITGMVLLISILTDILIQVFMKIAVIQT